MCLSCVVGLRWAGVYGHLVPCTRTRQRRRGSMRVRAPRFGRAVELGAPAPTHPRGGLEAGATMALRGRGSDIRAQHVFPLAPSTRIPAP